MPDVETSSPRNLLVVCFGNLCRSPMAEALLRAALADDRWQVRSAGTHAIGDDPPTPGTCRAMETVAGMDISAQRSAPLTVQLLRVSDLVFCMSRAQALEAAALWPLAAPNIRLLGAFVPDVPSPAPADPGGGPAGDQEIADPMGADQKTYDACCRRIQECSRAVASWIRAGADPDTAPPPVAAWR